MLMSIEEQIGQKMLLAFDGKDSPSAEALEIIKKIRPAGFTFFRGGNIDTPLQVKGLITSLQRIARDLNLPPFIIATDQEGGQLTAIEIGRASCRERV